MDVGGEGCTSAASPIGTQRDPKAPNSSMYAGVVDVAAFVAAHDQRFVTNGFDVGDTEEVSEIGQP